MFFVVTSEISFFIYVESIHQESKNEAKVDWQIKECIILLDSYVYYSLI